MLKHFILLFLSATTISTFSQSVQEKYARTITKEDLKKHLSILAGPAMEGRETGTEGQRKAAAYIVSQFKSFRLIPAPGTDNFQQFYGIGYDSLISSHLKIGERQLEQGKDYADETALNTNGNIEASEIVFVGYGISDDKYDDYVDKNVAGKIVVFFTGEPKLNGNYIISSSRNFSVWSSQGGLTKKAALAKQKGAAGAFVINSAMDSISAAFARVSKRSQLQLIRPAVETINCLNLPGGKASELLGDDFFSLMLPKAKNNEPLNLSAFAKMVNVTYSFAEQKISSNSSNVAGYIEGTDKKDEYVVLTGHYDHLGIRNGKIYYGADDDGSGSCAVIEMAEAFSKAKAQGRGPRRTILFMTVSGEEKGLWGSEYYSEHPLFPLEKTSVDLNTDMVGRVDPKRKEGDSMNYIYVIGDDKLSSDLKPISEGINNKYSQLELDYKYNDPKDPERIYYRSDHYNFARKGVPIIFYFNGTHNDYHQPTDTIDKIDWALYEKRVRFIFYTAWEMANRNDIIKRDIPLNQ